MPRSVNVEFATYLKQVDAGMMKAAAVTYSEILADLHVDVSALKVTFESSVSAENFVARTIEEGCMVRVGDGSTEDAREANLRRAALIDFTRSRPEWLPTSEGGVVFAPEAGDAYLIEGAKDGSGRWGFSVNKVDGPFEVDDLGRVAVDAASPRVSLGGGMDISDAVARFDMRDQLLMDAGTGYGSKP